MFFQWATSQKNSICMSKGLTATATVRIKAPIETVWDALINPDLLKKYMFGAEVISEFVEGSPIIWKGVMNGKSYEDKGVIIKRDYLKTLQFTHFSPLTGIPDVEENYHTLTYVLSSDGDSTIVTLSQDNNADEKAKNHARKNWQRLLESLRKMLEK
jgi:uncharacterized protein YndB with AHSA1/START domain